MNGESLEIDKLKECIDDLVNNLYVQTATWGLDYFEEELGIDTDISKSYEERREKILAKKRGSGTSTKAMIKNTAEAFSGGEVDVIENFEDYSFIVKFVGIKGIPKNIEDFKEMIDEIKPAHLAYILEYTYMTWEEFDRYNYTWEEWDAKNLTWEEFEVYSERTVLYAK
jgi:acetolactate synthase small subunit